MSTMEVIEGFERENYGAYVLKKRYAKHMAAALGIGVLLHLLCIAAYLFSTGLRSDSKVATVRFMDINELFNAPPLQENEAPPMVKIEIPDAIRPVAGMPIMVKDEEALTDLTIQTQEEIRADIAPPVAYGSGEGGEIKVEISGKIESLPNDDPAMDEVVNIEQQPVIVANVAPEYPELARQAGIEGRVILKALIDEKGNVTKVSVLQGDDIFKESAVAAVHKMKFKPAINGNKPIKVWITIPFNFQLESH